MLDRFEKYIQTTEQEPLVHYYGDLVRGLLLFISLVMLMTMVVGRELLGLSLVFGVPTVLGLTLLAGFITPRGGHVMRVTVFATGALFLVFEYFSLAAYARFGNFTEPVFLLPQFIALLSLVALYYSIKSLRGIVNG